MGLSDMRSVSTSKVWMEGTRDKDTELVMSLFLAAALYINAHCVATV